MASIQNPGDRLRRILRNRGLTQADLARLTHYSPKHINQCVQGKTHWSIAFCIALETALRTPSAKWWLNRQVEWELLQYYQPTEGNHE